MSRTRAWSPRSIGVPARPVLVGLAVLLLVLGLAVGTRAAGVWGGSDRTPLETAVRLVPPDTQRFTWTDWAAVRARLGADVGTDSGTADVRRFLDRGFDADLTSASGLVESTPMLQERFGWSPASIDWELLAQSTQGAVEVIGLPDTLDTGELGDRLAALGYPRPSSADGVWLGGGEALAAAAIGTDSAGSATPTLQNIAILGDRHLLLASDNGAYLERVLAGLDDHDSPVDEVTRALVDAAGGDPASAVVLGGAEACRSLAMAQADESSQRQATELVAQAGTVSPLTGFAIGVDAADRTIRVALGFEREDQARANADSRARLASGPAPGQGGSFADRFRLGRVAASGRVVTMELDPRPDTYVLSDLSSGPVLFATC